MVSKEDLEYIKNNMWQQEDAQDNVLSKFDEPTEENLHKSLMQRIKNDILLKEHKEQFTPINRFKAKIGLGKDNKFWGPDAVWEYFGYGNQSDVKPKAHDNINDLINDSEHKDLLQGLVMGMGGGGANVGKTVKNILTKIKARNARGLRNLREGQGTGAQSMSSSNREFLNKEWDVWRKLKDLVK